MPKISLITLGCAKNLVDSEVILGTLDRKGYEFTASLEKADILIINTCGFIEPARQEAHQTIDRAVVWKKARPGRLIMVAGCYVQRFYDFLKAKYPQVDIWAGVSHYDRLDELIERKSSVLRPATFLLDHHTPRVITTGLSWAYVKISEGCSHRCTFCSIPLIKGPYRSRSQNSVVQEVKNLASLGIREINLVSQDTTYFGRDRGSRDGLTRLLQQLIKIKDVKWIRVLYGYPEEITDQLLDIFSQEKICRYFDLPFQHASGKLLKNMGRSMNGSRALRLIDKIRRRVPGAVIRTSLIVGFPGEGKKEFEELKKFVLEAKFEHLGIFCYSPEPGTEAESLGDPVPAPEKKSRQKELMLIQRDISNKFYRTFLGRTLEVLVEGPDPDRPGKLRARAWFQAPEVDGAVIVEKSSEIKWSNLPPFLKIRVTKALTYDLVGKVIDGQTV